MAETVVYGCDWCDAIVKKDHGGTPEFAARVTVRYLGVGRVIPKEFDICGRCLSAFAAVSKGQYRR